VAACLIVSSLLGCAQEGDLDPDDGPELQIVLGDEEHAVTREELLGRTDVRTILIDVEAYPGERMQLMAIPLGRLIDRELKEDAFLQFDCDDGFSAPIRASRATNTDPAGSVAYLAIDVADEWPPIPGKASSAGPFYLVWENPELSRIVPEEWPQRLVRIQLVPSLRTKYPNAFPKSAFGEDAAVERGVEVFQTYCFPCHPMNGDGGERIGPDLNTPMNPTEYFRPEALTRLIRSTGSVRAWSGSKMPEFPEEILPNEDLVDLVEYLRYMAVSRSQD